MNVNPAVMPTKSASSDVELKSRLTVLEGIFRAHGDQRGVERIQKKQLDLNDSSVLVFVIGEGNFGKSSLINHLLGREIAAVSHLPKTWRIDLYRASLDGKEYAEIGRSNVAGIQRLSIEEALAECKQQEAQVFKNVKEAQGYSGENNTSTFEGQIIEVSWYYAGLATPKNIVLVDTPGFLQALGSNRRQIDTLSSREGVVFADLDAAYEYYYPRANLVMWAFRADRINDRDTIDTFQTLSEQKKKVLGVVTYFDLMKSEDERQESLRRARQQYGTKVDDFQPVITGGRTSQLGYGISALREHLASASDEAVPIKQEEAKQFILNEAKTGEKWMAQKGDSLIENVSQISFYCNATSGGLLKEAKSSNSALSHYFQSNVAPKIDAPSFSTFIKNILKEVSNIPELKAARAAGVQPSLEDKAEMADYFNRDVSEKLRISELDKQFQNTLHYISGYIVTEGKRQSAGHHLTQILIHQTSQIEKRKLEGQILPPNVQNLSVAFPTLPVPIIFSSGTDELLDFIGSLGDFAGGLLKLFGWQSKAKENERLMLSAIADTKHSARNLPNHMEQALREYVRQAAQSILKSADGAVGKAYPGKDLIRLKDDAVEIDKHLDKLQMLFQAVPIQDDSRYLYKTLFALWSPRDDPRKAVIDAFCEWFIKNESELRHNCQDWIVDVIAGHVLDKTAVEQVVFAYLTESEQTQEMAGPILAGVIGRRSIPNEMNGLILRWSSQLVQSISAKRLFNDKKNFLQLKFDGFELQGISDEFSRSLASDFSRHFDRYFNSQTVFVNSSEMTPLENRKIYGGRPIIMFSAIGFCAALGCGTSEHIVGVAIWPDILSSLGLGATIAGMIFAGNWTYQLRAFRRRRRDEMVAAVTTEICAETLRIARTAWQESRQKLNASLARQLIGKKTLIKKRALDFAIEGEFINTDF
jgi:GTP-binding protein EngB required for normal cell division